MWNAVIDEKATAGGFQDRYEIPPRDDEDNQRNLLKVAVPLLQAARRHINLTPRLDVRTGTLDANVFLELFAELRWHPDYEKVIAPFTKFVTTATSGGRITEWVVVWPQPTKGAEVFPLDGLGPVPVIQRSRRPDRIDFVGSDRKHTDAALPISRGEAVSGLPGKGGRGVVLIYLVDDRADPVSQLSEANVVPLLSVAVPKSATPHRGDLIRWTVKVQSDDAAVEKDDASAQAVNVRG
jgi:hypothetical protein